MKFFSIIVPTLNSAKTISVALKSIIQQRFTDYEILIIDGVSIDSTLETAKNYNDCRIKIYSEKDRGIYDAMNKGVKRAQGKWLYFLGSDDKLNDSDVLQQLYNKASINNYDVIYGDVYSSRFNGRYDGEFNCLKIISKNICHQAIFFKKTVFTKTGLFNLKYKSHADWDHNLRWFLNPRVRRIYINLNIAEYGDGGFSSIFPDDVFASEKNLLVIKYGLFSLPLPVLSNLTGEEYCKVLSSGKYAKAIVLKIINLYARLCLKFQS